MVNETYDWTGFETFLSEYYPNTSYEHLATTTSDGYIISLMHFWHSETTDELPPVFFMHGSSMNAQSWLQDMADDESSEYASLFETFADAGHHIYFGN